MDSLAQSTRKVQLYLLVNDFDLQGLETAINSSTIPVSGDILKSKMALQDLESNQIVIDRQLRATMPGLTGDTLLKRLKMLRQALLKGDILDLFPQQAHFLHMMIFCKSPIKTPFFGS